jgi:dTDP-4-amino-4,6-dideoxygalactose transaminase
VNDASLAERAEVVRDKGTNRPEFLRARTSRYTWVDMGSSYLPSELLAAFLTAQLESFDLIQERRHSVWAALHRRLGGWASGQGVTLPTVPPGCGHSAHLFYLLLPDAGSRQRFLEHLAGRGVQGAFHYQPLHRSPAGRRLGRTAPGGCPVTELVAERLVRLPLHPDLGEEELDRVVAAAMSYEVRR